MFTKKIFIRKTVYILGIVVMKEVRYLIDYLLDHVARRNLHRQRKRWRRVGRNHPDRRRTWKWNEIDDLLMFKIRLICLRDKKSFAV